MSQQELLKQVVDVFKRNNIDYMLTGSLVSSLQGDPRSTHDIDIVVTLTPANVSSLLQAFPPAAILSGRIIHYASNLAPRDV